MTDAIRLADPHPLTPLDPLETSVDPAPAVKPTSTARRPHGWEQAYNTRSRLLDRLSQTDDPHILSRTVQIERCSRYPSIRQGAGGQPILCRDRCKDRACPICAMARARRVATSIKHAISGMDAIRHLTLTMRHCDDPLATQIKTLISSYRRLRQTAGWRGHVDGAIACIQITRNAETGQWHPHIHALLAGDYYPAELIKTGWSKATGGSGVKWITPLHDREKGPRYIARYVASPNDMTDWPLDAVEEYMHAMRGVRTLITSGSMHNRPREPHTNDLPSGPTRHLASVDRIQASLRAGTQAGITVWVGAAEHMPALRQIIWVHPDQRAELHETPGSPSLKDWLAALQDCHDHAPGYAPRTKVDAPRNVRSRAPAPPPTLWGHPPPPRTTGIPDA